MRSHKSRRNRALESRGEESATKIDTPTPPLGACLGLGGGWRCINHTLGTSSLILLYTTTGPLPPHLPLKIYCLGVSLYIFVLWKEAPSHRAAAVKEAEDGSEWIIIPTFWTETATTNLEKSMKIITMEIDEQLARLETDQEKLELSL